MFSLIPGYNGIILEYREDHNIYGTTMKVRLQEAKQFSTNLNETKGEKSKRTSQTIAPSNATSIGKQIVPRWSNAY